MCAVTESLSAGTVGPRAHSGAHTGDTRHGGGGGGDKYDDDDDYEINSAMLYSLQS